MAGETEKPRVFKYLFENRYDPETGDVRAETVTSSELQDAIIVLAQEEGLTLSAANPANFLKDFLRSAQRNAKWPAEIMEAGYTARQAYGQGRVFDFVPMAPGQLEPFPDQFVLPGEGTLHQIEAVSMPSAARALGRTDESWLIQVCVHQRVLQTHFALFSEIEALDLFHLQNSLKGTPEIDAVFLLTMKSAGAASKAIITFEAKRNEPILPDQLRSQVALMAHQTQIRTGLKDIDYIIPVAANTITREGQRVVALFEMEPISVADGEAAYRAKQAHSLPLTIAKAVGYTFSPIVSGI